MIGTVVMGYFQVSCANDCGAWIGFKASGLTAEQIEKQAGGLDEAAEIMYGWVCRDGQWFCCERCAAVAYRKGPACSAPA